MYEILDWGKVLKGERILFNAVEDIYFTSKIKFEKLGTFLSKQETFLSKQEKNVGANVPSGLP
jgi:hypothetical protein